MLVRGRFLGKKKRKKKREKAKIVYKEEGLTFKVWQDSLLFYGFLVMTFLIPLIISRSTYDQFDLPKIVFFRIFTLALVFVYALKILLEKKGKVWFNSYLFVIVAFLVSLIISTIFSVDVPTAIFGKYRRYDGLITFFNYFIMLFLIIQVFRHFNQITLVIKVSALAAAISSIYGIMQFFGHDIFTWAQVPFEVTRSFSTLGNPALLAGYLLVVFPLSLSLSLSSKKLWETALYSFSTFLIFFCLVTTFNRTGWVATVIAVITFFAFLLYYLVKKVVPKEVIINFLLIGFLLFLFILAINFYSERSKTSPMKLVERAKTMVKIEPAGTFSTRLEIWTAALRMVKKSPFFGLGPDTFRLTSRTYQTLKYAHLSPTVVADNAHNYFLHLAAGTGIIGVTLFYLFVFFVFLEGLKLIRVQAGKLQSNPSHPAQYRQQLASESLLDAEKYLINGGLFVSFFSYTTFLFASVSIVGATYFWWLVFGLILTQSKLTKEFAFNFKEETLWLRYFSLAIISFLVLLGMISSYNIYRGDTTFVRASSLTQAAFSSISQSGFNPQSDSYLRAGIEEFKRAIKLNPYMDRYSAELGRVFFQLAKGSGRKEYFNQAVKYLKMAIKTSPLETDNYIFLADCYRYAGGQFSKEYYQLALGEADKAIKIAPYLYTAYLIKGLCYLNLGDVNQALYNLKKCNDYYLNFPEGLFFLGQAYEAKGNLKKALLFYKKSTVINPDYQPAKNAYENLKKRLGKE